MNNRTGRLRYFVTGFAVMALIIGVITVIPAIGQGGGNPNNPDDLGGADGETVKDFPSNFPDDSVWLTESERQFEGPAPTAPPADPLQNSNLPAAPDGKTDGGIESSILAANVQVLAAADFSSDGFAPDDYFFSFAEGHIRGGPSVCLMAPASPPDGSTLTEFWASVIDGDTADTNHATLTFYRVNNTTGVVNVLANLISTNTSGVQQLSDITIPAEYRDVQYPNYSYYVGTCLPEDTLEMISARVWWTP